MNARVMSAGAAVGVAAGAQETSVIEITRINPKMTISLDLTKVLITLSPFYRMKLLLRFIVRSLKEFILAIGIWFTSRNVGFSQKLPVLFFQPALLKTN
jgi:hypothetical protein